MQRADVGIVGAGIVGLAHAFVAARAGRSVVVFERNSRALGASVRNFGAFWPIGQTPGVLFDRAMRSRGAWLELAEKAGLWTQPTGSVFLAYAPDEMAVVEECAARAPGWGYQVEALGKGATLRRVPHANPDGLLGCLSSATEIRIESRRAIPRITAYLARELGVRFCFGSTVTRVEMARIGTAAGESWEVGHAIVASGDDFRTLYPEVYASTPGLTRCKLQMMRTVPQREGFALGPHIAGGLSLRFYGAFEGLESVGALRARVARERPELDRWGLNVMASQTEGGELILGDSHEYGPDFDCEYRQEVEDLILDHTRRMLSGLDLRIADRWLGTYAKLTDPSAPFVRHPAEGVAVITGVGGAGMTLSFGLAEEVCFELGITEHAPVPPVGAG
ncbi:MAG: TIGR03364 family FAD-dependent oxidoreductase [Phycisphaerales bacterium]|nr:TIGR03364 family FAD-dependent oxidoreductase [Phycisphaerales bacterium]